MLCTRRTRFRQVIVRPEFEPEDSIDLLGLCCEQQHGDAFGRWIPFQKLAHLKPREPWHHHIQDNQSRALGARLGQCARSVDGIRNLKTSSPQVLGNKVDDVGFVIGYEDAVIGHAVCGGQETKQVLRNGDANVTKW
jgi:hypothetical protein